MAGKSGWRRVGSKGHFRYVDSRGRRITDEVQLERIRALAIPPAWKDVLDRARGAGEAAGDGLRRGRTEAVPLPRRPIAPDRSRRSTTS